MTGGGESMATEGESEQKGVVRDGSAWGNSSTEDGAAMMVGIMVVGKGSGEVRVPTIFSGELQQLQNASSSLQVTKKVFFAEQVLKFTSTGNMKRCILLMTEFAIYIVDTETRALKRWIALAAVEKIRLSELSDNFFSIIIPTEYDTQRSEIVTMLLEVTKVLNTMQLLIW